MSRRASVPSKGEKVTDSLLKERVRELESEVSSLKRRLDELRKAKNTTILKKEKQYVSVGEPSISKSTTDNGKVSDLQKQIEQLKIKHSKELQDEKVKENKDCGHASVIDQMTKKCEVLEKEKQEALYLNDIMGKENQELSEKYQQLLTELSIKEAEWCEKEEQLNIKLKLQWGEKYREWMQQTEQKIADLQKVNQFLRTQLQTQAPKDDDPFS
ncbi:uncharacterized protein LOC102802814 [Saccoglossus kowalevskii]|uniref:Interaptin-like n=1 Tax=Saccoglossus kowalevskii TaxID=10224 RepID=A0ABM0M1G8_SACKO|nr:PREDICTED: interaptin-like [Saccoglossus kowalevskii]